MKALVLYDSLYGNTEKIARAIAGALRCNAISVAKAKIEDLKSLDFLIVGSPTHGGRPTPNLQKFLDEIPQDVLTHVAAATFDTRFAPKDHGLFLKLLMKTIGFAAPKISSILTRKGVKLIADPEGFIVHGKEGPLKEGELERATNWAKTLQKKVL